MERGTVSTDLDTNPTATTKMEKETMTDTNGNTKYRLGSVYFAVFGLLVLGIGSAEILLGVTGRSAQWGVVELSGEFLLWRGLILFLAGGFYLSSVTRFAEIHHQAKAVMASVMIWIVGGMQIFGMILGSIPGGEEGGWFNTLDGFLASYSAPYIPAVIFLPFSLVIVYYIRLQRRREDELEFATEPRFGPGGDDTRSPSAGSGGSS